VIVVASFESPTVIAARASPASIGCTQLKSAVTIEALPSAFCVWRYDHPSAI